MNESFKEEDFEALKNGDAQMLDKLYIDSFQYVMGTLIHKKGLAREDAQDLFSDALLRFHSAVMRDKVSWGNVRGYLLRIALNLSTEKHKENNTYVQRTEDALRSFYEEKEEKYFDKIVEQEDIEEKEDLSEKRLKAMSWAWNELSEVCREILEDTVINDLKPRNLMDKYSYKNTRVITDKKIKCKQRLLKLTQKRLKIITP